MMEENVMITYKNNTRCLLYQIKQDNIVTDIHIVISIFTVNGIF